MPSPRLGGVIVCWIAFLVCGCSGFRHHPWQTEGTAANDASEYSLRFIEADDEGWFWDRRQAEGAFEEIRSSLEEHDTMVVTFVHGWHHCARCCDSNVEGFRQTLLKLHELAPGFKLVGLYVGWRGQSLPMPFDYLSFWGRKVAAERVGQNDLKEFFTRLQTLYVSYRPDIRKERRSVEKIPNANFMGLVTIGHSFGAQVVLKAINGSLEDQLLALNPTPAYLRGAQLNEGDNEERRDVSVSGMGDLVVLLNPAVEASQYHRLHVLSQGLSYSPLQTPLILTVSAENDKARHRFFTFGRILGEIFTGKPRKDDKVQRTVEREALGVYRGHVTHQLLPTDPGMKLKSITVKGSTHGCDGAKSCESDWLSWKSSPQLMKPDSTRLEDPGLRTFDFSGPVVFNNVELSPLTHSVLSELGEDAYAYGRPQAYQPLIVARADSAIIDDHSGIFTDPFLRFLVPYIAYIEQKSKDNVEQNRQKRDSQMKYREMQRRDTE